MFFVFGFGTRKGGEMSLKDANGKLYTIFYIGNCFSIFFIPLFTVSKVYYIMSGSDRREISKDEYMEMRAMGIVPEGFSNMGRADSDFRQAYEAANYGNPSSSEEAYAGGICPICKKELDKSYAYCPYCGQKRPRA